MIGTCFQVCLLKIADRLMDMGNGHGHVLQGVHDFYIFYFMMQLVFTNEQEKPKNSA